MDEYRDVLVFKEGDLATSREAFDRLSKPISRFLHKYLQSMLPAAADRDDVIALTLTRIWNYRSTFEPKSLGAWWSLVAKTARRLAFDLSDRRDDAELVNDLSSADQVAIDQVAVSRQQRNRIYEAADELWLGIEPSVSRPLRIRRRLAAQLFYFDKRCWQEICRLLGGENPLDRRTLDAWLSDSAVLRDLAMSRLYWDNDRLAALVLRPSAPLTPHELDEWARLAYAGSAPVAPDGRPLHHARVLLFYFRNGMFEHKIKQIAQGLDEQEIFGILQEARKCLPFAELGGELCRTLATSHSDVRVLLEPGLWKRLVFAYNVQCELPHDHTLERVEPAASVIGYHVTIDTITMATSGGRLFKELARYLKDGG